MRYWGRNLLCLLTVGILCLTEASAASDHCGKACRQTFRTLRFADAPPGVFFTVQECTSLIYQTSLHLCWEEHCAEDIWRTESASMNLTCHDISGSYLPPHNIINNLTDHDIKAIPRFNATSPDRCHVYGALMLPSKSYYALWVRTLVSNTNPSRTLYFVKQVPTGGARLHMGLPQLLRLGHGDILGFGRRSRHR